MPEYPDWFVTWMQQNMEQFQPTEMSEAQPEHFVNYEFIGGINTDSSPDHLDEAELRVADNIVIDTRGAISKRPGTEVILETEDEITQIIEDHTEEDKIFFIEDKNIKYYDIENDDIVDEMEVASDKVSTFFFLNQIYMLDGEEYYVFNHEENEWEEVIPEDDETNDLDPVRKCTIAEVHSESDRVYFAGNPEEPHTIYYSEISEPGFVKETNRLFPTHGEGPVTALQEFAGTLAVFFPHAVWTVTGVDPEEDMVWQKVPTSVGSVNDEVVNIITDSLITFTPGGIYEYHPNILGMDLGLEAEGELINNIAQNRVMKLINDIENPRDVKCVYDVRNSRYMLAYGEDKILIYDFNLNAFYRWTNMPIKDFCYRRNDEILASVGDKMIRLYKGDYNGIFRIVTPRYHLDGPFWRKKVENVYIAIENPQINGYGVDVRVFMDDEKVLDEFREIDPGPSIAVLQIPLSEVGSRVEVEVEG